MKLLAVLLPLLMVSTCVQAHMSIWVRSMWGIEPNNVNSNWAVQPLENFDFPDWWMHGTKSLGLPPQDDAVTNLPAGGYLDFEITGNLHWTSMGVGGLCKAPGLSYRDPPVPWDNGMNGYCSANIHAPKRTDVAGCAIGIAYKSDINDVKPADFVIVSVAPDCIARQLETFDFPSLPACPNGKCICSWFWIHNSIGGTDQMYMTPFRCNITNPSTWTIGKPTAAQRCDGQPSCYLYPNWGNRTSTCSKVLNPMYWANNQGNNMLNPTNAQCAPIYNASYGYLPGAQNQIFTNSPAQPSNSLGDTLFSNAASTLTGDKALISPGFRSVLVVQGDGNLVMYDYPNKKVVQWASNTAGKGTGPYKAVLQNDGNFVVADSQGGIVWSTNTAGKGVTPFRLKLRDEKQLVVVDANSEPLWHN